MVESEDAIMGSYSEATNLPKTTEVPKATPKAARVSRRGLSQGERSSFRHPREARINKNIERGPPYKTVSACDHETTNDWIESINSCLMGH